MSKTFSGTPTAPNVTFTYDNTSVNFSKGRLTSVSSSASTTNVVHYDARGRVVQGNQRTEGQTYPFSYTYLRDSSLASMTYPSGRVVSYTYDNAGRPLRPSTATCIVCRQAGNAVLVTPTRLRIREVSSSPG